ncbi:MAG: preprotein translocase [Bacteroidetes bacterium]|jgi:sec-independent protein translocase protein TatA|nr:preprotein translocase [Bacteroidota bacterium]
MRFFQYFTYLCDLNSLNMTLLGIFGMGATELTVIVIVLLLMFGGKKIPELMRGLGKGMKEFKDASKGVDNNSNEVEKK